MAKICTEYIESHCHIEEQQCQPYKKIIRMGLEEKLVIPSIEKLNILLKGYFDSPATLVARS